jgi:hypothetical protein
VRAERGKENPLPPSASLPQKWKKVYKERDHVTGARSPIHPLPSIEHLLCNQLSTSSPPTTKNTQEHLGRRRRKGCT